MCQRRQVVSLAYAEEVSTVATQAIRSDPEVMMGKPVVEGTRITVESILEELGAGRTIEQLLEAHPRLTREGVLAAVRFGAEVMRADVTYPISKPPGHRRQGLRRACLSPAPCRPRSPTRPPTGCGVVNQSRCRRPRVG